MKKILIIPILFFAIATFVVSCKPEEEEIITGDIRAQLEGAWSVEESEVPLTKSDKTYYSVYIDKDNNDSTQILISNFYELGTAIYCYAKINGNSIIINPQTLDGGFYIEGNGSISNSNKSINLEYNVDSGPGVVRVTSFYSKQ